MALSPGTHWVTLAILSQHSLPDVPRRQCWDLGVGEEKVCLEMISRDVRS